MWQQFSFFLLQPIGHVSVRDVSEVTSKTKGERISRAADGTCKVRVEGLKIHDIDSVCRVSPTRPTSESRESGIFQQRLNPFSNFLIYGSAVHCKLGLRS